MVGTIGLTAISWGQAHPLTTNGTTINLTNIGSFSGDYAVTQHLTSSAEEGGSNWLNRGFPIGSTLVWATDPANPYKSLNLMILPDGSTQIFSMQVNGGPPTYQNSHYVSYKADGSLFTDYGPPKGDGLNMASYSYSGTWPGGGFGPGYNSGGGGNTVLVEQAAQLNIGLSFQNGQWTPSQ